MTLSIILIGGLFLGLVVRLVRRSAHCWRPVPTATMATAPLAVNFFREVGSVATSTRPIGFHTDEGWQVLFVRQMRMAEELLDQLEACGIDELDFEALGPSAFAVRWRDRTTDYPMRVPTRSSYTIGLAV